MAHATFNTIAGHRTCADFTAILVSRFPRRITVAIRILLTQQTGAIAPVVH